METASWAPDAIPHPCWRSWPSQPVYPFSPALIPMAVKYFLQSAGQEHLHLSLPGDTQQVRDLQIPGRPPICIFNLVSSDAYEWLRAMHRAVSACSPSWSFAYSQGHVSLCNSAFLHQCRFWHLVGAQCAFSEWAKEQECAWLCFTGLPCGPGCKWLIFREWAHYMRFYGHYILLI